MKSSIQNRIYPLLGLIAGIMMVVYNHWMIFHLHSMSIYSLIMCPPAIWGGIGALIEPRIVYLGARGPYRRLVLLLMALTLLTYGLLFWLYAVYYGVH